MDCLDDNTVIEFLDGVLTAERALEVEQHIDACADCRGQLTSVARLSIVAATAATPLRDASDPVTTTGSSPLVPGASIGRYVVLRLLGVGGMGAVYLAYDPELDRKIAVKVHRPVANLSEHADERLRREAIAMARLNHRNVVGVFDVGAVADQIFVAMELVDGVTLRAWRQRKPAVHAVLAACLQAGDGLAAAHQAGLVHRDVKPDNVLVAVDGRVLLGDFGLACTERAAGQRARVGTPSYMAPEQRDRGEVDPRSDQYSFCAMVYEMLYGELPPDEVIDGRRAVPAQPRVDRSLRRALERGLSRRADARSPSLALILQALRHATAARRRRWLGLAAGAAAIAAALIVYDRAVVQPRDEAQLCAGGPARLAGIWDDVQRLRAHVAFVATGVPYAEASWRTVDRELGSYRDDWAQTFRQSCVAVRVRGERSEQVLDRQMDCLDRRRTELASLGEQFTIADAAVVANAVTAAGSLAAVDGCRDVTTLSQVDPPPANLVSRVRIAAARERLDRAMTLARVARPAEARALAKPLVQEASQLGYRPLEAEVQYELGVFLDDGGDLPASVDALKRAVWFSEASRFDVLAAQSLLELVFEVGHRQRRLPEASELLQRAEAAVERAGRPVGLLTSLWKRRAGMAIDDGRYADAVAAYGRATALLRKPGADSLELANVLAAEGTAYEHLTRYGEARSRQLEALNIQQRALGDHPDTATTLENLGVLAAQQRDTDAALAYHRRALAIRERVFGRVHPQIAQSLGELAAAYYVRGDREAALAHYQRAVAVAEATLGADHPETARLQGGLAMVLGDLGRVAEAVELNTRVLAIEERAYGPDHPETTGTRVNLGNVLHTSGRDREALANHLQALAAYEKTLGPADPNVALALVNACIASHALADDRAALTYAERACAIDDHADPNDPAVAEPLLCGGQALLGLHRPERALAMLERALALQEGESANTPADLAEARFALARTLWELGQDRARAIALATAARAGANPGTSAGRAIEQWLRAHAPPRDARSPGSVSAR
jgi:tetratricopeptide (TPR) repeat protein